MILTLGRAAVLVACFAFPTFVVEGQQLLSGPPTHAIKFSPLHLINPELASVQIAYEYRFAERFSVQLEGGYVYGKVWWGYPDEKGRGTKLKEDLRWYVHQKVLGKRSGKNICRGMYLSIEFHQNLMEFIKDDHKPYRQTGAGFKFGFLRYSAWGFVIDANLGLSFATTNMEPLGIPLNDYQEEPNGYKVVIPIVGLRLGYWLK